MAQIIQDYLAMLVDLVLPHKMAHGKLVSMSIHEKIRIARERKGWSMEQLAKAVSEAENLAKPLVWQTVQQWEAGASAPKRSRMPIVAKLLGIDDTPVKTGTEVREPPAPYAAAPVGLQSTYSLLLQLSSSIEKCDKSVRAAVGGLLAHMCENPSEAEITARRIVAILGVPGNESPQEFSASQR